MFGLLKFCFYTFVAVVVGVVVGTVPIGGKTIAERVSAAYQSGPTLAAPVKKPVANSPKAVARATPRAKGSASGTTSAPTPSGKPMVASAEQPITAGAANAPDRTSEDDKVALDRLIATKARAR